MAEKKPEVLKPSISLSTSNTISTVIMKEKSPSVSSVIGNVKMRSNVPIVAFTSAINSPAIIALRNPSTCTPGIRYAAIKTARPDNKISRITFIDKKLTNIFYVLVALFFYSCQGNTSLPSANTINFHLNTDSSQIVLTGLDHSILQYLKEDSFQQGQLRSVYTVFHQFAQEEMAGLENPYPGKYKIILGTVIYTPDSGFFKGQVYRAELRIPEFYDRKDILNGKSLPGTFDVKTKEFKF